MTAHSPTEKGSVENRHFNLLLPNVSHGQLARGTDQGNWSMAAARLPLPVA